MTTEDHIVFIVDDDARIREALTGLLASHGMRAAAFASAGDYMAAEKPDLPACLILDVELPDMSGLDLRAEIAGRDYPPIVFLTGHGDISSSVSAIKHGAVDFLTKPFSDADLLAAITEALAQDREERAGRGELALLRRRYRALTPREREVLPLVISGLLNKQAAAELGISEVTLQIHRRNVMQKMEAASLADLVRGAAPRNPDYPLAPDRGLRWQGRARGGRGRCYAARSFASAGAFLVADLADLDALITDIGMPGMDGFELREIVRAARPELPVFMISGRHEIADQDRARGVAGFFAKPFDADVLLASVGDALRHRNGGG